MTDYTPKPIAWTAPKPLRGNTIPPDVIAQLVDAVNTHEKACPFEMDAACAPTGSRVICSPPVTNTDDDWLVFIPESMLEFSNEILEKAGATHSVEQERYPYGIVWWLGNLNIIVLFDYDTFYRWVAATHWAKKMNLATKQERKDFFGAMIDRSVPIASLVL